jgi:hypothetical protein
MKREKEQRKREEAEIRDEMTVGNIQRGNQGGR